MSMVDFEILSVTPMSDTKHPRELARDAIAKRQRQQTPVLLPGRTSLPGGQDAPPVGSLRRVIWAASVGHKRSLSERIKSSLRGIVQKVVGC